MEMLVLVGIMTSECILIYMCVIHHSQTIERFKIVFNSKHSIYKVKNVLLLLHILFYAELYTRCNVNVTYNKIFKQNIQSPFSKHTSSLLPCSIC